MEEPQKVLAGASEAVHHPRSVSNRQPTPQDLLELSSRIYKSSRKLYNEADSQGMRIYHDELIAGDVRLVMIVPSWFPKAHVAFDWDRVQGDAISVVFVLRGTMQDLVGNTKANLHLLFNKLVDDQHLPDVAADATKVIQAWLKELLLRHPALNPAAAAAAAGTSNASSSSSSSSRALHLDVHVTGHSLGGLLAEVATVESYGMAAAHGASWKCTSFESPGLPDFYHCAALRMADVENWNETITGYLAAPNPINMLYSHLGRVVHVVVPWEQTWSHVAKCVGADVARITAWAIVGGMVVAGMKQLGLTGAQQQLLLRQRQQQDDQQGVGPAAAAAGEAGVRLFGGSRVLAAHQCPVAMPDQGFAANPAAAAAQLAAAAVPRRATAIAGPSVPHQLLFTVLETTHPPTAAAARTLSSIAGAGMAAAAATATPPGSSGSSASTASTLTAAAAAAAAAAGEAAVSAGGSRLLHSIARKSGFGVLANVITGWVFGRSGIWGVLECLAGVLGVEVEELIAQHSLCPMRQCFDPHTGQLKARYRRDMASWPHLGHRRKVLLTAAQQVAKWTIPSFICRDNVGVANTMSRTAMVEARCSRLQGYILVQQQQDGEVLLDAFNADLASQQPLLLDDQQLQELGIAAVEAPQQQQQQHSIEQQQQIEVPQGMRSGLPGLRRRRQQQQQQQPFPRRLLLTPADQQQQQQQGDGDVQMLGVAAAAADAAEPGTVASTTAAATSATSAAARLCSSLQKWVGNRSAAVVAGRPSSAADQSVAAAGAVQHTEGLELDSLSNTLLGGLNMPLRDLEYPSSLAAAGGGGDANQGIRVQGPIVIRVEGSSTSGLTNVQCEGLAGSSNDPSWLVLDDNDEVQQRRRRRPQQNLLLS